MNIKELSINDGIPILGETWGGRGGIGVIIEGDIPIIEGADELGGIKFGGCDGIWPSGGGGREGDIPIIQTGGGGDGAGRDIPPRPICGGTNDFRGPWGKGDDDEADFSGGNSSGGGRDWSSIEDDYGFGPPDHHISGDGIVIVPPDFNGETGEGIHGDGIFGGDGMGISADPVDPYVVEGDGVGGNSCIAWPTGGGGENIDEADGEGGIKFGNQHYDGIKFGGSDFIDWPPGDTIPGLPIQWAVWPPGDTMPVQIDTNLP